MSAMQDIQSSQLLWEALQPHLREVGLLLKSSTTVHGRCENVKRLVFYVDQLCRSLQLHDRAPTNACVAGSRKSKVTHASLHSSPAKPLHRVAKRARPTAAPPPTHAKHHSTRSTTTVSSPAPSKAVPADTELRFRGASVQLTPSRTCADLDDAARQFALALRGLEFEEQRKSQVLSPLSESDIALLVNFFFQDVFGSQCQKRIYELVDELAISNGQKALGSQQATGTRASERAQDTQLPVEVRRFFSTFSNWHKGEVVPQTQLLIKQTIHAYDLYCSWQAIRDRASGEEGSRLRQFLAEQGFPQSVGVDIRTCILRYLSRELGLSRIALSNHLQNQSGIYWLVQEFGRGILVLLPKVAAYRIQRLGTNKIQKIIKELSSVLPEATILCRAAEKNVLDPWIANGRLPRLLSDQEVEREGLSLLDALSLDEGGRITELAPTTQNTPKQESATLDVQTIPAAPGRSPLPTLPDDAPIATGPPTSTPVPAPSSSTVVDVEWQQDTINER